MIYIFDIDFSSYHFVPERTFIWFSNLCFEQTTINDIFNKIKQSFPIGTIIACSKKIDETVNGITPLKNNSNQTADKLPVTVTDLNKGSQRGADSNNHWFKMMHIVSIPMSWSKESNVYIYTII